MITGSLLNNDRNIGRANNNFLQYFLCDTETILTTPLYSERYKITPTSNSRLEYAPTPFNFYN
jgi:hypothetical protein